MANNVGPPISIPEFTLEDWWPMEPDKGPPLPLFLNIYWPWYKPPEVPPEVYTCPHCGDQFTSQADLDAHILAEHPEVPPAPPVADIRVENLVIEFSEIEVGQENRVGVTATNYGGKSGSKTITFTGNGITKDQSVSLSPGESVMVTFTVVPPEARTFQVSVNGLTGSFVASAPPEVPPSGELLQITWWNGASWRPISEPVPQGAVKYRFSVRNTGGPATFRMGYFFYSELTGKDVWSYSPSVAIEPGEGNIDWELTSMPGTYTITFYLLTDDVVLDSSTVTITVVAPPPPPPPPPPLWADPSGLPSELLSYYNSIGYEIKLTDSQIDYINTIWAEYTALHPQFYDLHIQWQELCIQLNQMFDPGYTYPILYTSMEPFPNSPTALTYESTGVAAVAGPRKHYSTMRFLNPEAWQEIVANPVLYEQFQTLVRQTESAADQMHAAAARLVEIYETVVTMVEWW